MAEELIECQLRKRYSDRGMTLVVTASMREDLLPEFGFFAALMDDRVDMAVASRWILTREFEEDAIWADAQRWGDARMVELFGA